MRCRIPLLSLLLICIVSSTSFATITPIGPFTGTLHENFDEFPTDTAVRFLDLFNNQARITVEGTANSIKLEFSSSLGGDLVTPMSRLMCGQLGIADWTFTTPVTRFGGYWENNSHADDATAEFFDADGNLFDTRVVPVSTSLQQWQWNGWDFGNTPVSKIRVTGNGLINGFIWYENMEIVQAQVTPEPVGALVIAPLMILARRSQKIAR
jgi:hypothetical protein